MRNESEVMGKPGARPGIITESGTFTGFTKLLIEQHERDMRFMDELIAGLETINAQIRPLLIEADLYRKVMMGPEPVGDNGGNGREGG